MSDGNTQHFCQFLKTREARRNSTVSSASDDNSFSPLINNTRERCVFCDTKLSRYNGDGVCYACKERQKQRWLARAGEVSGGGNRSAIRRNNLKVSTPVIFYRSCAGACQGNAQTIHGEAIPFLRIIKLEPIQAIDDDGRCGQCGGPITLTRDRVPSWAKDFKVIPSRRSSVAPKRSWKAMSGGVEL